MNKYQIELEMHELLALNKALQGVKFFYFNYEASEVARSPITTDLIVKIKEGLNYYNSSIINEWSFIEELDKYQQKNMIKSIKFHLTNIGKTNWNRLDYPTKFEVVKELILPFRAKDDTINELIKFGNDKLVS